MLQQFIDTFSENEFKSSNVLRIKNIILFKFNDQYIFYNVTTKEWDGDYNKIPSNIPIQTCEPKQRVFRGTFLGEFLNNYQIPNLSSNDIITFLSPKYANFIEQALKLHFPFILTLLRKNDIEHLIKNLNATSLVKATELSTEQLDLIQQKIICLKESSGYYLLRLFKFLPSFKGIPKNLFEEILQIVFNDSVSNQNLDFFNQHILSLPGKLKQKLDKIMLYTNPKFFEYTTLRESLKNLETIDESLFPMFPKIENLDELIMRLNSRIITLSNTEKYTKWNNAYDKVKETLFDYEFTDGEYSIIIPKQIEDLDIEGNTLHHCVGSFKEVVSSGKEIILFLRKKDSPNIPYYTIDLDTDGFIRQIHTSHNGNISDSKDADKLMAFLAKWADVKQNLVNKKSILVNCNNVCYHK